MRMAIEAGLKLEGNVTQEAGAIREERSSEELVQTLRRERARADELARTLASEQIYSEKLAYQLRTVTGSRLWRAAQWLRRLAGRGGYVPDLERPVAVGGPLAAPAMADVFRAIYTNNTWASDVSHSGTGSDQQQTAVIRAILPGLLRELGVRRMLDLPCGDFHWMQMLDLDLEYIGADVVEDLIAANNARYGNGRRRFQVMDIANDLLPRVDLIFCRDLLVHFSFDDALQAISNLKFSGSTYLLTTTFTSRTNNLDIKTGEWRVLNLQRPPFNFPPPLRLINENCTERGLNVKERRQGSLRRRPSAGEQASGGSAWADKSLGLWRLGDL